MNSISIDVEDTKSSDLVDGEDEDDISEFSEKELNEFIEDYKKIIAAGKKVSIIIVIGDDSTNEKTKSKRLKYLLYALLSRIFDHDREFSGPVGLDAVSPLDRPES
uniref:Uncharacterized protein n=1 Tax=Rhizophagus irregularis (strain DAOM 181602 / DAOM 197198 / MUCL 43194) TaxID=747089 RepID=U9T5T2_RHIID